MAKALSLARSAAKRGSDDPGFPSYQLALGLAEFRNGDYTDAELTLTIAEQKAGAGDFIKGPARFFRAMSLFKRQRTEEARKLLRESQAQMAPLPGDEHQVLTDIRPLSDHSAQISWLDDQQIEWLACREARALLNESNGGP